MEEFTGLQDLVAQLCADELQRVTGQAVDVARTGDPADAEVRWLSAVARWWRFAAPLAHNPLVGKKLAAAVLVMAGAMPDQHQWDRAVAAAHDLGFATDDQRYGLAAILLTRLGINPDERVADDLLADCGSLVTATEELDDADAAFVAGALVNDVLVVIGDPDTPAEKRSLLVTAGLAGVATMADARAGASWDELALVGVPLDGDDDLARLARLAQSVIELHMIIGGGAS